MILPAYKYTRQVNFNGLNKLFGYKNRGITFYSLKTHNCSCSECAWSKSTINNCREFYKNALPMSTIGDYYSYTERFS